MGESGLHGVTMQQSPQHQAYQQHLQHQAYQQFLRPGERQSSTVGGARVTPLGNPGSAQIGPASWSPAMAGLNLGDDQNSRMARGSAAVADIVQPMQLQPWLTIQDKED